MKVIIDFETDNAAFESPHEVHHVLDQAVTKLVERGAEPGANAKLFDSNGNSVGTVVIENDKKPKKPKKLEELDLEELEELIDEYIEALSGDERPREDKYEHAIYEAAVEAFYGNDIFDRYINPASDHFDKMENDDESELN